MKPPANKVDIARRLPEFRRLTAAQPGITAEATSAALNVSLRQVRKLRALTRGGALAAAPAADDAGPAKAAGVFTLADLRRRFDVAEKIRLGIKEHLVGKDAFIDEARFRDLCGVHVNQWRRFATLPEFADFQITLQRVPHWAAPANIKKAREILGA